MKEYVFLAFLLSIMISIINVTGSNSRNLYNCLKYDRDIEFVSSAFSLNYKTKVLFLPGVSHFNNYIDFLNKNKWIDFIKETDLLVIGICAGYHALCETSDEAPGVRGVGVFKSHVSKINPDLSLNYGKVPHTGMRNITDLQSNAFPKKAFFVHSYGVLEHNSESVMQALNIAGKQYIVSQRKNNIIGLQYHPELSGEYGREMLNNIISEGYCNG